MKLADYIKSSRRGTEANRIELESMRDPLLGEAIEGFDNVPGNHAEALERLEKRIEARVSAAGSGGGARNGSSAKRRLNMRNWSVAAAAIIIVSIGAGSLLYIRNKMVREEPLLTQQTRKTEPVHEDVGLPPVRVVPNDTTAREETPHNLDSPGAVTRTEEAEQSVYSDFITVIREPLIDIAESDIPEDFIITDVNFEAAAFSSEIAAEEAAARTAVARGTRSNVSTGGDLPFGTVSGQVVDAETGEPLPWATIAADGKAVASTDASGYFSLPEHSTPLQGITASYLGYINQTVPAKAGEEVMIALQPDHNSLEEVVVVGYGTTKRQAMVGSVVTAESEKVTEIPALFREYLDARIGKMKEANRIEGTVTVDFDTDRNGRPCNLEIIDSPSAKASRIARRLLREGPDWEPDRIKHRIVIEF